MTSYLKIHHGIIPHIPIVVRKYLRLRVHRGMSMHDLPGNKKRAAKGPFYQLLFLSALLVLVGNIWKQCDDPCSFDSRRNFSLVHSAGAGNPLRQYFASVCYILSELVDILVIDGFCFVGAELAYLFPSHAAGVPFPIYHFIPPLII